MPTLLGLARQMAVLADQRIVARGSLEEVRRVDHPFIQNFFRSSQGPAAAPV